MQIEQYISPNHFLALVPDVKRIFVCFMISLDSGNVPFIKSLILDHLNYFGDILLLIFVVCRPSCVVLLPLMILAFYLTNRRKAVNVSDIKVFFSANSIYNPFANSEVINLYREMGCSVYNILPKMN